MASEKLTPEMLLYAYRIGIFPMAQPEDDNALNWYAPDPRGILPLDGFHCPQSLRRVVRQQPFEVVSNRDFTAVMRACAVRRKPPAEYAHHPEAAAAAQGTWISEELITVYSQLHQQGFAHSVECWQHGALVGGLYGVALGGAFFGESMFHTVTDASKVALVYLVEQLLQAKFVLLDVQFTTQHLARFGVSEIPRREYERRLSRAVRLKRLFPTGPLSLHGHTMPLPVMPAPMPPQPATLPANRPPETHHE